MNAPVAELHYRRRVARRRSPNERNRASKSNLKTQGDGAEPHELPEAKFGCRENARTADFEVWRTWVFSELRRPEVSQTKHEITRETLGGFANAERSSAEDYDGRKTMAIREGWRWLVSVPRRDATNEGKPLEWFLSVHMGKEGAREVLGLFKGLNWVRLTGNARDFWDWDSPCSSPGRARGGRKERWESGGWLAGPGCVGIS